MTPIFLLRIDLFDLLFCYETSYQTCQQISFKLNDEMILQSKCTGQYTVYVDYFICMCFIFPASPQSLWRKRMWPLHLFVLMHLRKQKNGRPGHSIWHKTPLLQQHLGGGLQLLLGRIEVGFLELRYESSTLILYKELSSPIFQSLWLSESGIRDTGPYLHSVQYVKA